MTVIHPGGRVCESWTPCENIHLVREAWELDGEDAHGEEHQIIQGYLCVRMPGCWMDDRIIEFNERTYPNGIYDIQYEAEFDDMGLFISDMEIVK